MIRKATAADVPAIVDLSEQKRTEYERYQPVFWKKAADSRERQLPFIAQLIQRENVIALVHEQAGQVNGFVIASLAAPPPVYSPGLTCMIDDYCVAAPEDWATVGESLLQEVLRQARERGAMQAVVVCGHRDQPKRSLLAGDGFTIASEWYVKPLA